MVAKPNVVLDSVLGMIQGLLTRLRTKSDFFLTTFAKTQGEKNSTNPKTQGLFGAKTQRTGSEIAIMNFKTSNICAERAEKMQFLVFFDQISPKSSKK